MNKVPPREYSRLLGKTFALVVLLALAGCSTVEKTSQTANPVPATAVPGSKSSSQMSVSGLANDGSPLNIYDRLVIEKIRNRWYQLLEKATLANQNKGSVHVEFRLHSDGQVSGLKVYEQTTDEVLANFCQLAISDSAPFPPWPEEVRKKIGKDYRKIIFNFNYE